MHIKTCLLYTSYNSNFSLLQDGIRTYKDMYKAGLDKFNVPQIVWVLQSLESSGS